MNLGVVDVCSSSCQGPMPVPEAEASGSSKKTKKRKRAGGLIVLQYALTRQSYRMSDSTSITSRTLTDTTSHSCTEIQSTT